MSQKLYHANASESPLEIRSIHPSLIPHLLGVSFAQLTPYEARRIVVSNVESVLSDFISEARQKGVLK
jgi:hypothetical protein